MLRLLFWSLRHRRTRHLLNAFTILVTVAVVMVFISAVSEILAFTHAYSERQLTRVNVIAKMVVGGGAELPMTYESMLKEIPGVEIVQKQKAFFGKHQASGATYFVSGEEDSGIERNTDIFPVAPDVFEAWKKDPLGAIITEATVKQMNLSVGQSVELPTPRGPLKVNVVGISYKASIANRVAVHFDYLDKFMGNTGMCSYRLFAKPAVAAGLASIIEEKTKNSPVPATSFTEAEFASGIVSRIAVVPVLLGFLGAFLLVTTAITLANNSATSIRERRMETATLRVLGYRRGKIVRLLLGESIVIGMIAGALSIVITWFIFRHGVLLTVGPERLLGDVKLTPFAMIVGAALAILVPLSGALPSAIASIRTPVNEALRDAA
ncbi:MAG TPA: FtsX-like permease family protein [Kofleriaceae bacterium]|jgi:putative ABC transport system permease protein